LDQRLPATDAVSQEPDVVVVGRVGRPHGVRGEVTVLVHTDDPDTRFAAGAVLLTDPADRGPLTVVATRRSGEIRLLAFDGVGDRDAAERLRGTTLLVPTADLPALEDEDEFYDHQLVGLRVVDPSGAALGVVGDVLHAPAAPVLVVTRPDGSTELVPFVAAVVPTVDLAGGVVVVEPPDGMFA
jgi:16S rRNA processing protein RimM